RAEDAAGAQGAEDADRGLHPVLEEQDAALAVVKIRELDQRVGDAVGGWIELRVASLLAVMHDRGVFRPRGGREGQVVFVAVQAGLPASSSLRSTYAVMPSTLPRFSGTTSSSSTTKPKASSSQVTSVSTPIESMIPACSRSVSPGYSSPSVGKLLAMNSRTRLSVAAMRASSSYRRCGGPAAAEGRGRVFSPAGAAFRAAQRAPRRNRTTSTVCSRIMKSKTSPWFLT